MKRMQEEKIFNQIKDDVSELIEKHLYKHRVVLNFDDSIYLEVKFLSTSNEELTSGKVINKLISGDATFSYEDGDIIRFSLYIKTNTSEIVFVGSSTETYLYTDATIQSYDIDTLI